MRSSRGFGSTTRTSRRAPWTSTSDLSGASWATNASRRSSGSVTGTTRPTARRRSREADPSLRVVSPVLFPVSRRCMRLGPRFSTLFGVLAACAAIVLVVLLDATVRKATEDRVLDRVSREAEHLSQDWLHWTAERPADADRLLREAAAALACRITIVGADGRVFHDTDLPATRVSEMENHGSRPEILDAHRTGSGTSRRFSATESERRIYYARALSDGSVLRVSVSVAGVEQIEQAYLWTTRVAIFGACILLFLIGSAAARRFSEPIGQLT